MANAIDLKVQPTHLRFRKQRCAEYPIAFNLQQGDKQESPDELTLVSDSGERVPPTQQQVER